MQNNKVILFLPVSCAEGIGEYMRSTIIANALTNKNKQLDIHFGLNKTVNYYKDCKFTTHPLSDTPTKCSDEVYALIDKLKPNVVVFDASGRASQVQYAKQAGAKVIFISQHKRKRAKGLGLSRLKHLDKHFVAQPDFAIEPLTAFEKIKLSLFGNNNGPENVGAVFAEPNEYEVKAILEKYKLTPNQFVLLSAGSGGHMINNQILASELYLSLSQYIQTHYNLTTVTVLGPNYTGSAKPMQSGKRLVVSQLSNKEFIALLKNAKYLVLSGGDTVLQAVTLNKPTLTTPVSKDQPARIAKLAELELVMAAQSDVDDMKLKFDTLVEQTEDIVENMELLGLKNGADIIVNSILEF